jgi:hypothetical protein
MQNLPPKGFGGVMQALIKRTRYGVSKKEGLRRTVILIFTKDLSRDRHIVDLIDQHLVTSGHFQLPSAACDIAVRAPGPGFGRVLFSSIFAKLSTATSRRSNTALGLDRGYRLQSIASRTDRW